MRKQKPDYWLTAFIFTAFISIIFLTPWNDLGGDPINPRERTEQR